MRGMRFKKFSVLGFTALYLFLGSVKPVRADLFGGDVVVLTQILVQAIMQVAKLKEIIGTATDQLDLMRDINRGINDSLYLIRTIDPNIDPGIYKEWNTLKEALHELESIYGVAVFSPDAPIQKDLDRGIAEAVTFNNSYYRYTKTLDEIGEEIKTASHLVSPGGAQKLTAQSMGLMIQVLNQNLRAQATSLKLHAQELAVQNRKEKADTKHFLEMSRSLKKALQSEIRFELPEYR